MIPDKSRKCGNVGPPSSLFYLLIQTLINPVIVADRATPIKTIKSRLRRTSPVSELTGAFHTLINSVIPSVRDRATLDNLELLRLLDICS